MDVKPERGLVRLSGVGNDPALVTFCREEWPRLVGSLSLYVGSRELAEDLAQEALYRVCRQWRSVGAAESPSAWAHRVAFNLAKSHGRRQSSWRRAQPRLVGPSAATLVDPADVIAVRVAVAALPETQRAVIVLRYFTQLSIAEVAAVMRCPENTVKTHTRRGLEALRSSGLLADDAPIEETG